MQDVFVQLERRFVQGELPIIPCFPGLAFVSAIIYPKLFPFGNHNVQADCQSSIDSIEKK